MARQKEKQMIVLKRFASVLLSSAVVMATAGIMFVILDIPYLVVLTIPGMLLVSYSILAAGLNRTLRSFDATITACTLRRVDLALAVTGGLGMFVSIGLSLSTVGALNGF